MREEEGIFFVYTLFSLERDEGMLCCIVSWEMKSFDDGNRVYARISFSDGV